jgi:class 3 adenylate cyclase
MLMTDIEGSTALLDHLGDSYRDVLDAVRSVLRMQIEAASGCVVEIRADEVFAVFAEPLAAVAAAVGTQRELAQRAWPDGVVVRIRVGIHSGYPTLVEANYLGMAVHTTARICAAAHGGQTLASGDTKLALKGTSLNGIRFQSLGIHHLRGIPDDVHLHQLEAKGLLHRFPPVRTARGPL